VKRENEKERTEREYRDLIYSMDIPKERQEPTQPNIRWFIRNGAVYNLSHPNYSAALKLARQMLSI
jgi:hypothetical protein